MKSGGWTLIHSTDVLLRRGKLDTERSRKRPHEDIGRRQSSTSQEDSGQKKQTVNIDLRHLAFRTVKNYISAFSTAPSMVLCFGSSSRQVREKLFYLDAVKVKNYTSSVWSPKDSLFEFSFHLSCSSWCIRMRIEWNKN